LKVEVIWFISPAPGLISYLPFHFLLLLC